MRNLRTEFVTRHGRIRAVDDITFDVYRGEVLGVVGESGSGKSVAARSIMRMIRPPGKVVGGQVILDGIDLMGLRDHEMQQRRGSDVAMVFQDPQAALNPVMTVGQQLIEAQVVHGVARRAAARRALELLHDVGIPHAETRLTEYPHQFSGGMRQRVVIAIALANSPKVLIADEPTTALDVTIQAQILRLLVRLVREHDLALVIITHDMGVVAETCNRVAVMYGGRLVEQGAVDEILSRPRHPYTAALLEAMPRLDDDHIGQPLPAIPGSPPDPAALPPGCAFAPRCRHRRSFCDESVPALLTLDDSGHQSACFVVQRGGDVDAAGPGDAESAVAITAPRSLTALAGATPPLEVRGLRVDVSARRSLFRRGGPVFAVDSVSLSVGAGETLGLVGESGCGKSTLSRSIVGITPIASGQVLIDGHDVTAFGHDDLRRLRSSVQYLFQDPYASLNPRRTVRQSLVEALSLRGLVGSALKEETNAVIERVGLRPEHLDRYPRSFSGGQRQRIGIARALARQPRVVLLDEPVSALDMSIQAQIINLLEELQQQLDLGFLFIAHDLAVVRHLSDRVAVMYLGRIVETGPAAAVYSAPLHPYTVALLSSSPVPTVAASSRKRIVLRGDLPSLASPPSGCRFRTRCPIGPATNPERTICVDVDPELADTGRQHHVACHFAGEMTASA